MAIIEKWFQNTYKYVFLLSPNRLTKNGFFLLTIPLQMALFFFNPKTLSSFTSNISSLKVKRSIVCQICEVKIITFKENYFYKNFYYIYLWKRKNCYQTVLDIYIKFQPL